MSAAILLATPYDAFGELLRLSLAEQGHYQVRLVHSAQDARASLSRQLFQMVIVDHDLQDEPFVPFCFEIMAQYPNLRVVVIPPENNPNHPALGGLIPHGYLSRPFYLPDLLEMTRRLLDNAVLSQPSEPQPPGETLPEWLEDTILLQGYLEKLLASSEAVAALVGQDGKLRANAGRLPLPAAQEMAELLLRYWDREEKADLMRFIRLTSVKGDYLAYVTEITDGLVLMMAYEPGVAISQVRPQTRAIAQAMASAPPPDYRQNSGSPPATQKDGREAPPELPAKDPAQITSHEDSAPARPAALEPATEVLDGYTPPADSGEDFDSAGLPDEEPAQFDLTVLLGTVPSPDPHDSEEASSTFGQPVSTLGWTHEANSWEPSPRPGAPASLNHPPAGSSPEPPEKQPTAALETTAPRADSPGSISLIGPEPAIDPLGDTQPHVLNTVSHISQLEPVSPALSLLNYTCVLIPRLPHHYLTGELADRLAQWVQQYCLAFGWRLEGIAIRPDYLQWTVQVAPSVSPGNLVRILRQRTSSSIFSTYEHLKAQNPSGDFWAAGYLIVSGSQPPSAQLLRDYIQQTRKRQGILKP